MTAASNYHHGRHESFSISQIDIEGGANGGF